MSPARRPALACVLALVAACSPQVPAPAAPIQAAPVASVSTADEAPTKPPAPAAPEAPLDPNAVRCGVDDSPVEIGSRDHAPLDRALVLADRGALGFSAARVDTRDFSSFQLAQPVGPANAPLDPGVSTLTIVDVRRNDRALAEDAFPKGLLVKPMDRPRERLLPCALSRAQDKSTLTLELSIAANGLPVSAIARAPGLTAVQSRCLGEMACKLTLPAEDKGSTLLVQGKIAFTAPGFKGTAIALTRRASRARGAADPAFAKLDRALTKIASACTRETPPVATFSAEITLRPSGKGQLSAGSFPSADAAGAILGCLADHLGEAPTVSMATLRDDLVTSVTVTVAP